MICINDRFGQSGKQMGIIVIFMLYITLFVFNDSAPAELLEDMMKCAAEANDSKRLNCYDKLAKQNSSVKADASAEEDKNINAAQNNFISMMDKLWDLKDSIRKNAPLIKEHHPSYFLLAAYNTTPNRDTQLDVDPLAKAQNLEAKFQLSGKARITPKFLCGKPFDLWVGYTQLSFWQLYNSAFSSPFRDTNYEPEAFITYRTNYKLLDLLNLRIINLGFDHQSNGRARPLSRSWNRWFAELGLEKVFNFNMEKRNEFNLFVKGWYRNPENSREDDNPDIEKYMGNVEIRGVYYWHDCSFSMMLRNNLRTTDNKGALQIEGTFPFPEWFPILGNKRIRNSVKFYIQYFTGYGECLLDYNSSSNRISLGLMITNW